MTNDTRLSLTSNAMIPVKKIRIEPGSSLTKDIYINPWFNMWRKKKSNEHETTK